MARRPALPKLIVGWREWLALPGLGVEAVKAKVDTGARTSAIHAFNIVEFRREGDAWLRFEIHPLQRNQMTAVIAEAPLVEYRQVRSSTGHASRRPVALVELELAGLRWPIELTLASRDQMGFRMLLGRQALRGRCTVDPGRSYLASKRR
ncbi:MAG: ATP-dependent zinc protease [Pirellulales bacterium]|nr:ATP-dependent zinc protease [Pirellulales bacterium]